MNLAEIMRPGTLDEVIGNAHITEPLKNQLASGTLSQTILLTGPSGTGKTTIARILANELQADVSEVDCGADGGVDRARGLVESASLGSLFSNKKVFMLDEAHLLSKPAQSAFLKSLEDLNEGVHFILMTTDPNKLLPTILTRTVRYETTNASNAEIGVAVNRVLDKFKIEVEEVRDFWEVIVQSEGSLRAVYTFLEKIISVADDKGFVSSEAFQSVMRSEDVEEVSENLALAMSKGDIKESLAAIRALRKSNQPVSVAIGVYNYLRAVYTRSGKYDAELMANLALMVAEKNVTWEHLESLVWRS